MVKKILFLAAVLLSTHLWAESLLHTVRAGDTLETLAEQYGASVDRLRAVNRLKRNTPLEAGDTLVIPRQYEPGFIKLEPLAANPNLAATPFDYALATQEQGQSSDASSEQPGRSSPALAAKRLPSESQQLATRQFIYDDLLREGHVVQEGETLSQLAQVAGLSVEQLKKINRLAGDSLSVRQVLLLPMRLNPKVLYSYLPQRKTEVEWASLVFKVPENRLRRLNNLTETERFFKDGQSIYLNEVGQKPQENEAEANDYLVQNGDTLWGLSQRFHLPLETLRAMNPGLGEMLEVGMRLRTTGPNEAQAAESGRGYTVKEGDTVWGIARSLKLSVDELLAVNQVDVENLRVGVTLRVPDGRAATDNADEQPAYQEEGTDAGYQVEPGDTLWSIASRFGTTVKDLRAANPALGDSLKIGETLRFPPPAGEEGLVEERATSEEETSIRVRMQEGEEEKKPTLRPPEKPDGWGSYFVSTKPAYKFQPSRNYFEDFANDPLENYQKAKKLIKRFDREIAQLPPKGRELRGYHFVIDPGHGGMDPGFVGLSQDGEGKSLYIIEDEYNYDISLRLYRELKLHGAEAILTVISPNHGLIEDYNPQHTFVSQKNEVYNSPILNRRGDSASWPVGNSRGLRNRRVIAEQFFVGVPKSRRVFISIHNDNTPEFGEGRLLLYFDDGLTSSGKGAAFARSMVPYLGIGAHYRGQNLGVLRDNPADFAILAEMRNIAYQRNSWAIRYVELRQQDAEMLTNALLQALKRM